MAEDSKFTSSVSCPASAYIVIMDQLHALLKTLQLQKGISLTMFPIRTAFKLF